MADFISQIGTGLNNAVSNVVSDSVRVIPGLIVAVIFIIVGWIVGNFVRDIVAKILNAAKLDAWADEHKLTKAVGGIALSRLAGTIVKWYIILLALQQAAEALALSSLRVFVGTLISYLPGLLGALVIFILGLLLAKYVRNKLETTRHRYNKTIAIGVELLIIYISLVLALKNMGFDVTILEDAFRIAFTALALTVAVVLGISFGLAFKHDAKDLVNTLKREYRK